MIWQLAFLRVYNSINSAQLAQKSLLYLQRLPFVSLHSILDISQSQRSFFILPLAHPPFLVLKKQVLKGLTMGTRHRHHKTSQSVATNP